MQITTTDGRGVYLIFSDSDFVAYVLISYRSIDRSVRRHLRFDGEKWDEIVRAEQRDIL